MDISLDILKDVKSQLEDQIGQLNLKRKSLFDQIEAFQEELNRKKAESEHGVHILKEAWESEKQLVVHDLDVRKEGQDKRDDILTQREQSVERLEEERRQVQAAQKAADDNTKQLADQLVAVSTKQEAVDKADSDLKIQLYQVAKQKEELELRLEQVHEKEKQAESLLSDLTVQKQAFDGQNKDFTETKVKLDAQATESAQRKQEQDDRDASLNKRGEELNTLHSEFLKKSEELQKQWQRLTEERFKLANEAALIAHQKGLVSNG